MPKRKQSVKRELTVAQVIYEAFKEGFNSYSTPCCAFNSVEEAWDKSEAKKIAATLSHQMSGFFE